VSGASYSANDNAISAIDFGTYRAILTHTGVATDPSADATNWVKISSPSKASQATAEAGTNNDDFMTSLRTAQAIAELAVGGGFVVILTQTVTTAVASVDFTLSGGYKNYLFVYNGISPASNGATLFARLSVDGGSTFKAGSTDYSSIASADNVLSEIGTDRSDVRIANGLSNATNESASGAVYISNVDGFSAVHGVATQVNTLGNFQRTHPGGMLKFTGADALRLVFNTGNITAGTITLYGIAGA